MPQFPEEYVTEGWTTTSVADDEYMLVNNNAVKTQDVKTYMQLTPRVITGNATLAATDRTVVIDAAGTVAITLDTGSASRAPCAVLRKGTGGLHVTGFIPPSGGTINGGVVNATYAVYGATADGERYTLWSSGPLTWHVDTALYSAVGALIGTTIPALTARVTDVEEPYRAADASTAGGTSVTWDPQYTTLLIGDDTAKVVVTLDHDTGGGWVIGKPLILGVSPYNTGGFGIQIALADPTHTLNGQAAGVGYTLLPGSTALASATQMPPVYIVIYAGGGAWSIRPLVDQQESLTVLASSIATITGTTIPALAARVTALEAPTAVDTTAAVGAPVTWTTAKAYRATDNARASACTVLLDEDLVTVAQWPVGESRGLSKYNTSVYGLQINVGSTDTLNGGTAGTGSGVITGSTAVPGPTVARPTVTITRDDVNKWSWK